MSAGKIPQRLKFHAEWMSEITPKTPVEGLEAERKGSSSSGNKYLFIGLIMLVVMVPVAVGMIETSALWIPMVISLLAGVFLTAGFGLKANSKDIDYMIDAEEEVNVLRKRLIGYSDSQTIKEGKAMA